MTNLTRFQPARDFLSLRDTMDRLFDDRWVRPLVTWSEEAFVPVEMVERDNEIEVRAPVPGFEAKDIEASVEGDVLTLRGSTKSEKEEEKKDGNYHLSEWSTSSFQRMVRLPASVAADKAVASYKNGILSLKLPKAATEATKRIPIQG